MYSTHWWKAIEYTLSELLVYYSVSVKLLWFTTLLVLLFNKFTCFGWFNRLRMHWSISAHHSLFAILAGRCCYFTPPPEIYECFGLNRHWRKMYVSTFSSLKFSLFNRKHFAIVIEVKLRIRKFNNNSICNSKLTQLQFQAQTFYISQNHSTNILLLTQRFFKLVVLLSFLKLWWHWHYWLRSCL